MPVTLAQAKLNVQDDLQMGVIDEFAKNNYLMSNLIFEDCVSPTGGGATLTYSYTRLITQPTAQFRAINSEYTPQEVTRQRYSTDLKVFGGSFQIDRVIASMGGIINEVTLQMQQKIKAAGALFNDAAINGDSAVDANSFDGLDKALTGSSTEYIPAAPIDLSSTTAMDANYKAFLDEFDYFLRGLDGTPTAILGNRAAVSKLNRIAQRAARHQTALDNYGRRYDMYDGIPMIDLGAKAGTNDDVVSIDGDGNTSIYIVRLGLDGLHAVSIMGEPPVKTWLPDYTTAGAVKTGEVEMVASIVLKATKAAGVIRDIKVR